MEKLLVFGADDAEFRKINQIASRLKMRLERVDPACCHLTLGEIVSGNSKSRVSPAFESENGASVSPVSGQDGSSVPSLSGSLLVMCNLPDKRMDKLLFELRRASVMLDYKAVLTPTNAKWTLSRLMLEMQREKAAYAGKTD